MKYLKCHTNLSMEGESKLEAIEGKNYLVVDENDMEYFIIDESGDKHSFGKDNRNWSCFKNWFFLIYPS